MSMYGRSYSPADCSGDGKAKQSMKDECDVNLIVSRFAETGLISHLAGGIPQFVDVSALGDYRSIIEQVRKVDEYFAGLPADVRSEFRNDASLFMDYLESGASVEDLQKLGLAIVGDRRVDKELQRRREADEVVEEVVEVAPEEPSTVST